MSSASRDRFRTFSTRPPGGAAGRWFRNSVYEQFFQRFSPNVADTHGIVYTPREIVEYMCNSVEQALKDEFGYSLASPEVVILDPCTGTGNFIVNLIERMPGRALREAYRNRLFANEVMLLPYYVSSLNIEHAYYERMREYEPFPGLCSSIPWIWPKPSRGPRFTAANTERVDREKEAAITVIIGNPPYNVGQKSENDNNKNRKYKVVDDRIRHTYSADSKATNKNALSDMYVKFFRWEVCRIRHREDQGLAISAVYEKVRVLRPYPQRGGLPMAGDFGAQPRRFRHRLASTGVQHASVGQHRRHASVHHR